VAVKEIMSYKIRTIVVIAALVLAGCGSDEGGGSATTANTAAQAAGSTTAEAESQSGLSAATAEVDGIVYMVSCTAVSPSSLSDPLGTTGYVGGEVSARLLAGVNVANAIAIEVPGGACGPGDRQLSDWSLATAQGLDTTLASQIACDSGLKAEGC
jgi:hypothetical protein